MVGSGVGDGVGQAESESVVSIVRTDTSAGISPQNELLCKLTPPAFVS
jgi:hypothetical protein